jgi:hypothetical protein
LYYRIVQGVSSGVLRTATRAIFGAILIVANVSGTNATQLKLTLTMAIGGSPTLSVVANKEFKNPKEERMATKFTTLKGVSFARKRSERANVIQLLYRKQISVSSGVLRTATRAIFGAILIVANVSGTNATQLKLIIT